MHAYGCGDPGVQCGACAESPPPAAPRDWRARARHELETLRRLRWIHVSTLAMLEVGGVLDGLGQISQAMGQRICRYGERRLREHYQGQPPPSEVET